MKKYHSKDKDYISIFHAAKLADVKDNSELDRIAEHHIIGTND